MPWKVNLKFPNQNLTIVISLLKFGLSKNTKFEKIFIMVRTFTKVHKSTQYEEDYAIFCVLLRKSELYNLQHSTWRLLSHILLNKLFVRPTLKKTLLHGSWMCQLDTTWEKKTLRFGSKIVCNMSPYCLRTMKFWPKFVVRIFLVQV